jgi:hypothetical protein
MLKLNDRVIVKKGVDIFHYQEKPFYSLAPVLTRLKVSGEYGVIRRIDADNDAVAVQFPRMKDFVWFKTYELVAL